MMAAMVIVMVVFLVMSGHHGFGGSHERDAGPPAAQQPSHMHNQPAGEGQEERK